MSEIRVNVNSAVTFVELAAFVDAVRAQSKVPDRAVPMQATFNDRITGLWQPSLVVNIAGEWNRIQPLEYLDHPVVNGTVVVIDEGAIAGTNVPVMFATLAREQVEIHLGIRATHAHAYGRVQEDGNVLLPGLGLYAPHAFRVIRLLSEYDG